MHKPSKLQASRTGHEQRRPSAPPPVYEPTLRVTVDEPTRTWLRREAVTMAAVPRPVLELDEPTQLYKSGQARAALLLDAVNTEITEIPGTAEAFQLLREMQRTPPPPPPAADDTEIVIPVSVSFQTYEHALEDGTAPDFRTRINLSVPEFCLLVLLCLATGALLTLAWLAYQPLS